MLAFNAVVDGERAILAHVYGADPFPNSRTFVFHIRKSHGTFGTVLSAALPAALNRNGYLKRIVLNLRRDYVYRGRRHSYLSASCGAPQGADHRHLPLRAGGDDLLRRPQARLHLDPHLHGPQISFRR